MLRCGDALWKTKTSMPVFVVVSRVFAFIAYFAHGKNPNAAISMTNRFGSVLLAAALGMSVEPVDMTRNLSTLKVPRSKNSVR